jgi:sugar phosphate isomerase/epimerase
MVAVYLSAVQGLAEHKMALDAIRKSGMVSGLETRELSDTSRKIKEAGLQYAIHDPHFKGMNNLADPLLGNLYRELLKDSRMEVIRHSDAPVVGFHCGYASSQVYKMSAYSDIPVPEKSYNDALQLRAVMLENLRIIDGVINHGLCLEKQKRILIESMDYIRPQPVDWSMQSEETRKNREAIEETISTLGVNAGLRFVHELSFLDSLLHPPDNESVAEIGYLFDISHLFITADAKIHEGIFIGSIEDYFEEVMRIAGSKIRQIHVNVPSGNEARGYLDQHRPFMKNDPLSDRILELARYVIKNAPDLSVITLEMAGHSDPLIFAVDMVKQAEYFTGRVFV